MAYRTYTDPAQQYQGEPFNPMTGRLQGGQLVMQFMNRMREEQERKKAESQMSEEMAWKQMLQGLQKTKYEQDIAAGAREARDYQTPEQKAMAREAEAGKAHDRSLEEIAKREEERRKTLAANTKTIDAARKKSEADLRGKYITEKQKVESSYTAALKDAEKQYAAEVSRIRKDKTLLEAASNTEAGGNPYLIALQGALASRKRMRTELDTRKKQQLEQLDAAFKEATGEITGMTDAAKSNQVLEEDAGEMADADEYGYVLDEVRDTPKGTYKYIGGNKWIPVKK